MRAKFIYEKFTQDSDPIEDMGIGEIECSYCKGYGSRSEHYNGSIDPETGEHDCRYCPIEVECEYCGGTGRIFRQDIVNDVNQMKDPENYDLPF